MWIAWLLACLGTGQQDPAIALRAAVDLPHREERLAAAHVLASRADVGVEHWLSLVRGLEPSGLPGTAGTHREQAFLDVGEAELVSTELWLHVARSVEPSRPAPLIVALHGSGGDGASMVRAWQAVAEALGAVVLAPTDPDSVAGYAYTGRERRTVLEALRWTQRRLRIDPDRVHLTGVSRGGHLAWDLALRHPDRFASLVPMVGGPRLSPPARNNLRYLENVVPLSIRDLQGAQDDALLLASLRSTFARLAQWKAPDARLIEFPDLGHDVDWQAVDWGTFLGQAARRTDRDRVVRACARANEGRAFWVEVLALEDDVAEDFTPTVSASWSRLSEEKRREVLAGLVDERTARLEVTRKAADRFEVRSRGVRRFRILLDSGQLPSRGEVQVRTPKTHRVPVRTDARILLEDFVERLDTSFLPVAEVVL